MKSFLNKFYLFLTLTFLFNLSYIFAAGRITGNVVDSETGTAIAGAKVKDISNKKVTYTNKYGTFYLPNNGNAELTISSIGYEQKKVNYSGEDNLKIKLKTLPNIQREAVVTGEFDVNQIVAKAIEKKVENQEKIKTFKGLLYSKLNFELDGSLLNSLSATGGNGSISLGATLSPSTNKQANEVEKYKYIALETFSNVQQDKKANINHVEIIQRRQTANIPNTANILAITKFVNLYDEEINIVNAQITSPLAKNAFSYYNFKLIKRSRLNDKLVYEIAVEPSTSTYPAFEGNIKLVEGSFSIIEANLKTSANTAIQFVEGIEYNEKFDVNENDIWYPSYLDIHLKLDANLLTGFLDFNAAIVMSSNFTSVEINTPLPDSLYINKTPNVIRSSQITVAPMADSIRTEFWNNNSLREISEKEESMYRKIDSLVKLDTNRAILNEKEPDFKFSYLPYLNYNRVEDLSLGISPELEIYNFATLFGKAYYSFGQKKPYGELGTKFKIQENKSLTLILGAKVFSDIISQSNDKSFSKFENTLLSMFFASDYYDYVRKDGYEIFLNSKVGNLKIDMFYTARHNSGVEKRSDTLMGFLSEFAHWTNNQVRPNNDWDLFRTTINYSESNFLEWQGFAVNGNVVLSVGENGKKGQYSSYDASFRLDIPTFKTGYGVSELTLLTEFGHVTENAPLPHTFRLKSRNILFTPFGNFATAPIGYYGGNLYQTFHARWNTSDLLWRYIGLPKMKGRGLDFVLGYSAANYKTNINFMKTMGSEVFQEVSWGFGRIPTYISDLAFWNLTFSHGISKLNMNRFAVTLGFDIGFKFN